MDSVVVDSSVVIKWLTAEVHSAEARRVLTDFQAGKLQLLAPDLLHAEVGNITWKKVRFQGLSSADADAILLAFQALPIGLTSSAVLLEDAFRIATAHERSVYDSLYLALSVREKCRVVTADERLFNAVSAFFPQLVWVSNWP